jgi:Tol biopolymer transport system component
MLRTALAVLTSAAIVVTVGASAARGSFPGASGKIAFVNDRDGTPSIYTMNADGAEIGRLVPNQPQGAFPAWSPGGQAVLFSVLVASQPEPQYELWTMGATGNAIHRFLPGQSSDPISSTWSPDRKKIAFYRNDYLWIVNVDRTGIRRLTRADFSDGAPSWSRGGQIAFDRDGSIWVVDVRTGAERSLVSGSEPSWSPDGRRLLFVATPSGTANNDVFVMRANGSGRHQLTATAAEDETQPAWSPNGLWVAYSTKRGVYAMRPNGDSPRLVTAKGWQASWAPKSSKLVYAQQTGRWDGLLFRVDLSGKHKKQLLRPRLDASPRWSPGGERLAFSRDGVVYLVNADGSDLHSIGMKGSDPAWSPYGNKIAVSSGLELVVAGEDGIAPTRLHLNLDPAHYQSVSEPDWSPDGTKIAFVATETSDTRDIFVVGLAVGAPVVRLPLECGSNGASSPTWSPSGVFLGFNCDQSIAVAQANGKNLVPIGSGLDSMLAWSPDGTQIVFSDQSDEHIEQLFVMNSDGAVRSQLDTGPGASDQPDWQSIPIIVRPSD